MVTHQPAVVHQPAERPPNNPAAWQDFDPVDKGAATVAVIHPQQPEPDKPSQHPAQECFGPIAPGCAGKSEYGPLSGALCQNG